MGSLEEHRESILPKPTVIDTFNRPDNPSSLGLTDSGHPWTLNGTWGTLNGKAYTPQALAEKHAVVDPGLLDIDLTVDIITVNVENQDHGIVFKYIDPNNYLLLTLDNFSPDELVLYKRDTGVYTKLATVLNFPISQSTKYSIRILIKGTTIYIYVNGVLQITYTLSAPEQTKYLLATKIGLRSYYSNVTKFWTNFKVRESV